MSQEDDAVYFRKREAQELAASERSVDPTIKRLRWEMAQRYAYLASEAEAAIEPVDAPNANIMRMR